MEYKVEILDGPISYGWEPDLEAVLNEKGRDGWELVNIIPQVEGSEVVLIFRRPIA